MQQHHSDIPPEYTTEPRPPKLGRPPFWMIAVALIAVVASWLPLVLAARARAAISNVPRIQIFQDMGVQPKYREQQSSEVFADGRADRPRIAGTVARGEVHDDDHYYLGYSESPGPSTTQPAITFFDTFPDKVKVSDALMARGQQRFNIYCSVCHGLDGQGHGPVNERALELQSQDPPAAKWTQVADLTSDTVKNRPVGHIFNTINVGIRSMPSYGAQIPVQDRWAIVAYVRALQQLGNVPSRDVPDDIKERIRKAAESK